MTILTDIGEASTDPLTLRLQGETQTYAVVSAVKKSIVHEPLSYYMYVFAEATGSSETPTLTPSDPSDDSSPFYVEAAFIIGMVILAVCVLFIAGAVLLFFVRPRGDPGFLASPRSITPHLDAPTRPSDTMNLTTRSHGTRAGSWSPGQPIWVHTHVHITTTLC